MNEHGITLRVTASAGDVARVAVRRQQFAVGRPIEFDEAAERIAEAFSPDDAAACLLAIQALTMPAPFLARLGALLGNSDAGARPNGMAADMSSPPPPSS